MVQQISEDYAAARAVVRTVAREVAPVTGAEGHGRRAGRTTRGGGAASDISNGVILADRRITGYACACPDTTAPTTPAVVLDPFGGTGTTALVASVLGRHGITVDMSADYCRLAAWRTSDPGQRAKAARVDKPPVEAVGQLDLFDMEGTA